MEHDSIDFAALDRAGCKPLKIIATDVGLQRPVVFASQRFDGQNEQVVDAVRASISYPLVFQPVRVHDRFLVNGGLCSNLPVFAFEKERRESNLPIVAFDLIQGPRPVEPAYGFLQFCRDMISTSLESRDFLIRDRIQGLHYIPIPVPEGFHALRFHLPPSDREVLFHRGYTAAMEYFTSKLFHWKQTFSEVERLQALMSVEPDRVKELLQAMAPISPRSPTLRPAVRDHATHGARHPHRRLPLPDGSRSGYRPGDPDDLGMHRRLVEAPRPGPGESRRGASRSREMGDDPGPA